MCPLSVVHRTILVVDVEGFGDRRRTNYHQVAVRRGLYAALQSAFRRAGIAWADCDHEDRGDGVFILAPADLRKGPFVETLPPMLVEALISHNETHPAEERIRLRLALHAGEISYDDHGATASSINLAFRLLDAPQFKDALAGSAGLLAVIVSSWFYDEVVRNSAACDLSAFRSIRTTVKETNTVAWICLPDQPGHGGAKKILPSGPETVVPRQLPARTPHFVGRSAELRQLDHLLEIANQDGGTVVITAINGTAGIGKSALAVHWAHAMREAFPDGQLYVNLRGYDAGSPVTSEQALDGILRTLDVPGNKIPSDLDAMSVTYRSLLANRRMLVVLDNAATPDQVRPLLSSSPTCMVLVTSRNRLSGLVARDGAHRITLELLPPHEAISLLRAIIGNARARHESQAVAELARRCAYLPLALRIAGERVAARPHLRVADLVGDLTAERDRLDVLATDDDEATTIRSVFSWSYRSLTPEAARAFRLLGMHSGPEIGVLATAALTDTIPTIAARQLEALASVHLIDETGRGRYAFHDLLRSYAAERAADDESEPERTNASWRMLQWYLHTAHAASNVLYPQQPARPIDPPGPEYRPVAFASHEQALHWCDLELPNLMAAIQSALDHGSHAIAWQLPTAIHNYLRLRSRWTDRISAYQHGLDAARQLRDRRAEHWILVGLGETCIEQERFGEAITFYLQPALAISRDIGDRRGEGVVLHDLGRTLHGLHEFGGAIEHLEQALMIYREVGDQRGEGIVLSWIGDAYRGQGKFGQALDFARQGLAVLRTINSKWDEARALRRVGLTYRDLGRPGEAIEYFQQAMSIYRHLDHRYEAAKTLHNLGQVQVEAKLPDQARDSWREALTILDELNPAEATEIRTLLTNLNHPIPNHAERDTPITG